MSTASSTLTLKSSANGLNLISTQGKPGNCRSVEHHWGIQGLGDPGTIVLFAIGKLLEKE